MKWWSFFLTFFLNRKCFYSLMRSTHRAGPVYKQERRLFVQTLHLTYASIFLTGALHGCENNDVRNKSRKAWHCVYKQVLQPPKRNKNFTTEEEESNCLTFLLIICFADEWPPTPPTAQNQRVVRTCWSVLKLAVTQKVTCILILMFLALLHDWLQFISAEFRDKRQDACLARQDDTECWVHENETLQCILRKNGFATNSTEWPLTSEDFWTAL